MSKERPLYITKSQQVMLNNWGEQLRALFNGTVAYHVGSSLTSKDWFDVDVRLMLEDEDYKHLSQTMKLSDFDAVISQWGERVTGLPIDFQVQSRIEANTEFKGVRNAMMR